MDLYTYICIHKPFQSTVGNTTGGGMGEERGGAPHST